VSLKNLPNYSLKKRKRPEPKKDKLPRSCSNCGTTSTPEWRKGPEGPRTLCNACGLKLNKRVKNKSSGKQDTKKHTTSPVVSELRNTNNNSLDEFTNVARTTIDNVNNFYIAPSQSSSYHSTENNQINNVYTSYDHQYQPNVYSLSPKGHVKFNESSPSFIDRTYGYSMNGNHHLSTNSQAQAPFEDINHLDRSNVFYPSVTDFEFIAEDEDCTCTDCEYLWKRVSFYSNPLAFFTGCNRAKSV